MRKCVFVRAAVLAAVILAVAVSTSQGVNYEYTIQDLGTLGGEWSKATGINNAGQVVGESVLADGSRRGFVYSNGTMTNIGTLGGNYSFATGINNLGQVIGGSATADGIDEHAFIYGSGMMTDLGTLGGHYSRPRGINDLGQVVGESVLAGQVTTSAFLYSNGVMTCLPQFIWNAYDINNLGQIVGTSVCFADHYNWQAAIYSNGAMTYLGPPGGSSDAIGINDAGEVIGTSSMYRVIYDQWRWSNLRDVWVISTTAIEARAINNSHQVVGDHWSGYGVNDVGFLYEPGSGVLPLVALDFAHSGWVLRSATGINDQGQIVGWGYNPAGEQHAFLMTPVPEPATLLLAGIGAMLLRRKR